MAALATLPTTTFYADTGTADGLVSLTSTADVQVGLYLVSGAEAMQVTGFGPVAGLVTVLRGKLGTASRRHAATDPIWIGRGDQFYETDPVGPPVTGPHVQPRINVLEGNVWWPVYNGTAASGRWVLTTATYTTGALGVPQVVYNPTAAGVYTT